MFKFIAQYIKNPSSVGAIAPSSRFLANGMVRGIDFDRCRSLVEYGPGTGAFTAELLRRKRPETPLLAIERNEAFCRQLTERFAGAPNFYLVNAGAEEVAALLEERDIPIPETILSGLPFASLPAAVSEKILGETARLLRRGEAGETARFVTFQYTLFKLGLLGRYFDPVERIRVWRNLPPAHILVLSPKSEPGA